MTAIKPEYTGVPNLQRAARIVIKHITLPQMKMALSEIIIYFLIHRLCVSCHTIEAKTIIDKPNLAQCSTCHKTELSENLTAGLNWKINLPHFNNVILPDVKLQKIEKK